MGSRKKNESLEAFHKRENAYQKKWRKENRDKVNKILSKYRKTKVGRAKRNKVKRAVMHKRRGRGSHWLSFEHPGCVGHHINKNDIVACPKEIHEKTNHSISGIAGMLARKLEGVLG